MVMMIDNFVMNISQDGTDSESSSTLIAHMVRNADSMQHSRVYDSCLNPLQVTCCLDP